MPKSTLYVIGTPIGNLADMTYRAVEVLKRCKVAICEDTRRSGILFSHYDITISKQSYHAQSSDAKLAELIQKIQENRETAYVTDAGTPGISDPGMKLVKLALQKGIHVVPVPGASALTTLMSVSGAPTSPLVWLGFFPHKKGRQTILKNIKENPKQAFLGYESVHRIEKLLKELIAADLGERWAVIGREMTKKHEEFLRGSVFSIYEDLQAKAWEVKGEFAVYIAPEGFAGNG